jgi:ATP-dependent RNA helicase DDX23/PRP28
VGGAPSDVVRLGGAGAGGTTAAAAAAAGESARTTHMFSATFPPAVQKLAKRFMRTPVTVQVGDADSGKNRRIAQEVMFVPTEARKRSVLVDVLARCDRPAIVFVNAKKQCDVVGRDLEARGVAAAVLHGGKAQEMREDALAAFKAGEYDVLIATDVAGRGLDIPDVAVVINYDMPGEIDRYQHRIGRTGRAGKTGKAVTFLCGDDTAVLGELKAYMEATGQAVPPELAQRAAAATGGEGGGPRKDRIQYSKK